MWATLISTLSDANTQWVLIGTVLLGIASGVLGSFALLRKQSLLGDAMAHAALPGICIAFLLYGSKSIVLFLIGAAISGLIATYFIQSIISFSRIKEDTAIGLILSVFFGFGIVLLTFIAQNSSGNQSGLDDFIFGQAASLIGTDVKVISGVAITMLVITLLLFKEFKLLTFDPQFAKGIGLPTGVLNALLMVLIVGAVVIGLQAVGVVLMAAMLITPAIAARYWTERLDYMVIISGAIGAVSGILGTLISTTTTGMPTGPLIIVAATIIFLVSMIFAPNRGLLMKGIRLLKLRKLVAKENILLSLYDFAEEMINTDNRHYLRAIDEREINQKRPLSSRQLNKVLLQFSKEGIVKKEPNLSWHLTEKGLYEAYNVVLKHRLMEIYLMHEMKFAAFHVKHDNHSSILDLPKNVVDELKKLLIQYGRQPKLVPSSEGSLHTVFSPTSTETHRQKVKGHGGASS
ncbi:metal ABC transporter permease [Bacillus sp. SM2101]|uniref:metal ABC transporter permease n=1 Tax=Bacillus sp. SM2101 TaxID=2805366 RepID=UPI001BDEEE66|nr:metal ABC transporter permease [Bacillus sp. SM2101]